VTQKATDTGAIESYAGPVTAPPPDVATPSGTNPYPVFPFGTLFSAKQSNLSPWVALKVMDSAMLLMHTGTTIVLNSLHQGP